MATIHISPNGGGRRRICVVVASRANYARIKTALAALGLSLGMRIDPNVLGALGRTAAR